MSKIIKPIHKGKGNMEQKLRVSWDIANGGDEWIVQFWLVDKNNKMTLIAQLDKNSDGAGNFDLT